MIKSYKELLTLKTFDERFNYLKLGGIVGDKTFGFDRYLNQAFYNSSEWKRVRRLAIIRDNGCDLAIPDLEILGPIIVHHINPINVSDLDLGNECLLDLNNLICTSRNTSDAIHYGDSSLLYISPVERKKGDTLLWQPNTREF